MTGSGGPAGGPRRQPAAIPHTLSPYLCLDFVNSRFTDHTGTGEVHDRLAMLRFQEWFADRAGVTVQGPPEPETYRRLVEIRALLRKLLQSQAAPDARALARINGLLGSSPARIRLTAKDGGVDLDVTWGIGWDAVIAAVLYSYGGLLAKRQPQRLRCCASPHCTFLFYDESRNGSRRWCDPAMCGNLHGVREHRRRQRRRGDRGEPWP
jgi:predicted RNA-binding Zn ribbon-like protein